MWAEAFEAAWVRSPPFRALQRATTASLGLVLIAEAALRVAVVYGSAGPDVVVTGAFAQVPAMVLVVAWFLAVRFLAVPRVRRIIDGPVPAKV